MTRRQLILKVIKPPPPDDPNDLLRMNAFAIAWTRFKEKFDTGVTDLKLWEIVVKRGRGLFCKGPGECLTSVA